MTADMHELVEEAGRDEDKYVSVDRAAMTASFLDDLVRADPAVGDMSVQAFLKELQEVVG